MKQAINTALKQHLDGKRLDTRQLAELQAAQRAAAAPRPTAHRRHGPWLAAAAILVLSVGLSLLLLQRSDQEMDLVNTIAGEVVRNHLHRKPLEVEGSRFSGVQAYFEKLDFSMVDSDYLADLGLTLLGGRYCSLRGITAAQLRYRSARGKGIRTLYQVGYDPTVFHRLPDYGRGEAPVVTWSKGVKVTLWVEKGVLFALTEEPGPAAKEAKPDKP